MKRKFAYVVALLAAAGLLLAAAAAQEKTPAKASSGQSSTQTSTWKGQGTMSNMQGQMGTPRGRMGMVRSSMMRGMESPLSRSIATVYVLPDMKSQLSLTTAQATQLQRLRQQFLDSEQKDATQIESKRAALDTLLGSGKPSQDQVTKAVTEIANLEAHQQVLGYESALKMRALLTDQQRSNLDSMQPGQLWNTMISNLTVRDMAQMMRYMHGAAGFGMMGSGVMAGGMMAGGGMMQHGAMMGGRTMSTPTP
jgi:hypothetical protein